MGFRFRRSLKIVPGVRLNLNKSGASVSLGGRGFRYTIGSKGTRTTVGIPGTGLSFTQYKPYTEQSYTLTSGNGRESSSLAPSELAPHTETVLSPIQSTSAEEIGALSTSELAPILNAIHNRLAVAPIVVGGFAILMIVTWSVGFQSLSVMFAACSIVFGSAAIFLDRYRRSVAIDYDLANVGADIAEALSKSFVPLRDCHSVWTIHAQGVTSDWKRNAGATRLNRRKRVRLRQGRPACIRGNVSFPCVSFGSQELYFLPDATLFIDRRSVAALHYRDITIRQQEIRFIEDEHVPPDATVVGYTWRFVNKKGGPDRRFNNNRQIPICLYSQIDFFSEGGLNGCVQLSNSSAGETLVQVVDVLRKFLGGETSMRPVSSYRGPKQWPAFLFVCAAVAVATGVLASGALMSLNVGDRSARSMAPPSSPTIVAPESLAESLPFLSPKADTPTGSLSVPLPRPNPTSR